MLPLPSPWLPLSAGTPDSKIQLRQPAHDAPVAAAGQLLRSVVLPPPFPGGGAELTLWKIGLSIAATVGSAVIVPLAVEQEVEAGEEKHLHVLNVKGWTTSSRWKRAYPRDVSVHRREVSTVYRRSHAALRGPGIRRLCGYFLRLTCAVAGAVQGSSGQGCLGYRPRISARTCA